MKSDWLFEGVRNHIEPTVYWRVCRIRRCWFEHSVYSVYFVSPHNCMCLSTVFSVDQCLLIYGTCLVKWEYEI